MRATGKHGTMEARLEALERERGESAVELARLRAANVRLHEKVAAIEATQRPHPQAMSASTASTRGSASSCAAPDIDEVGSRRASRRGMLRTALGATAAVVGAGALLTTETSPASADQGPTQFSDLNSNEVCVGVYGAGIGVDAATLSGTAIHAHTGAGYLARVRSNTSTPTMTTAIFAEGGSGYAIYATSQAAGFEAIHAEGVGANGLYSKSDNYSGVWAVSTTASAVTASSTSGYGVYAASTSNYGIYATSAATGLAAVRGEGANGANGVIGASTNHVGVWGTSTSGSGVNGSSTNGNGVYAVSASSDAIHAIANTSFRSALYAEGNAGYGIFATSTAQTGVVGASINGTGVEAHSTGSSSHQPGLNATSASGDGAIAQGGSGYAGVHAVANGVSAGTSPATSALFAEGGNGYGAYVTSQSGYGIYAQGGIAPLYLQPAATTGRPTGGAHQRGEFFVDSAGALYFCTASGTPGVWKQVTLT